ASTSTAFYLHATLAESEGNRRRAEEEELKGQHKLWEAHLAHAHARRLSRQPGQRFDSLRAIEQALLLPVPPGRSRDELRTEAIACLLLPDLEVARDLGNSPDQPMGFAMAANFERYARGDRDGNVSVRRVEDDAELFRLPTAGGRLRDYTGLG